MANEPLTIGFSPCPNDTYIFDALVHERIDLRGLQFEPVLGDVEQLNQWAAEGRLDISKLSYHAFGHLSDRYKLLNSGSALGRGVGPLLVAREPMNKQQIEAGRVAIPGAWTTANFLLGIAYPGLSERVPMLFSEIEQAVLDGRVDAGLLIHENRFTYQERGLHKLTDLGEFWEGKTGLPIPLGGIALRRNLEKNLDFRRSEGATTLEQTIDQLVGESLRYAIEHPRAALPYIREHAQAMDTAVMQAHIDLYVNDFSLDLGEEGRAAVRFLLQEGRKLGIIPEGPEEIFVQQIVE